uniref:Snodprot n=1 Tax=Dactylellina cionopaga TaxID=47266 RepID=G3FEJ1_9PEZI|nr:snodprot [Dactylellina cionopaga]
MLRFIVSLFFLVAAVAATGLKYDNNYNLKSGASLTSFACSDGANGLITKYHISSVSELASKLKSNVYIAGSPTIAGWNSPSCGLCYEARNPTNNKSFLFVAVDVAHPDIVSGADAFVVASPNGLAAGTFGITVTAKPLNACFK